LSTAATLHTTIQKSLINNPRSQSATAGAAVALQVVLLLAHCQATHKRSTQVSTAMCQI